MSGETNRPHSKYLHVYAIVRVDDHEDVDTSIADRISVTKVLFSEEEANAEAKRLNGLRRHVETGTTYFVRQTRLHEQPDPDTAGES